jgi:zinc transporter ZupT
LKEKALELNVWMALASSAAVLCGYFLPVVLGGAYGRFRWDVSDGSRLALLVVGMLLGLVALANVLGGWALDDAFEAYDQSRVEDMRATYARTWEPRPRFMVALLFFLTAGFAVAMTIRTQLIRLHPNGQAAEGFLFPLGVLIGGAYLGQLRSKDVEVDVLGVAAGCVGGLVFIVGMARLIEAGSARPYDRAEAEEIHRRHRRQERNEHRWRG